MTAANIVLYNKPSNATNEKLMITCREPHKIFGSKIAFGVHVRQLQATRALSVRSKKVKDVMHPAKPPIRFT